MPTELYAALPGTNDVFIDDGPKAKTEYGLCAGCHSVRLHSLAALKYGSCAGNCRNGSLPHTGMCLRCGNEEAARRSIAKQEASAIGAIRAIRNARSEEDMLVILRDGGGCPMTPQQIAAKLYGPTVSKLRRADYEMLKKSTLIEQVRHRVVDGHSPVRMYRIIGTPPAPLPSKFQKPKPEPKPKPAPKPPRVPKRLPPAARARNAEMWLKEHPGWHLLCDVAMAPGVHGERLIGRGGSTLRVKRALVASPNVEVRHMRALVGGVQTRLMDHCRWIGVGVDRQGIQGSAEEDTKRDGAMEGRAESGAMGHYTRVLSDAVDRGVRGLVLGRGGDACRLAVSARGYPLECRRSALGIES